MSTEYNCLGQIDRQPLLDIIFTDSTKPTAGPFSGVREFHDWLSNLTKRYFADPANVPDPMRPMLPDNAPIIFTHGDLHPSNIMISAVGPCRVLAIIDWQQSGWYPAYWEYCKAAYTAIPDGEWEIEYLPRFLEIPGGYDIWEHYSRTLGY